MADEIWREFLELYKDYVAREGTNKINQNHIENGKRLGVWIVIQRKHFREGKLSVERIKLLDDAGMDWDPHSSSWEKFYALSVQFAVREGHINVPTSHQEGGEYLNRWLRRQKWQKEHGKLTSEQIRRMEQLPGWGWHLGDTVEEMLECLRKFKAKKGHINVPTKLEFEGKRLGMWVDKVKQEKRNGSIDPKLEKILDNLGIQWEILEAQWDQYYLLLLNFIEREGHADVLQTHREDGERLGVWVNTQRTRYRKGRLPQARVERLEQVDFIWEKRRGRIVAEGREKKTKKAKKKVKKEVEEEKREAEEINYDDEFDLDLDGEEAGHLDTDEIYHQDDHHHFFYDDNGDDFGGDDVKSVSV